ncbi:DNA-binding anti-repressor SinI [Halobacillus litoralis]|uniref:DNA-binding anti-repressor SinI n=1 Tax=Halobacillus litoralis TaxID=45668 RepID=A0A845F7F3_9BACI|nr:MULTISPECIES: anti-repressor SinI family protein [Halobacillus]MEC3884097.1 anti-repressor SinI family protein [Halobacillus sp. HZG1]MYL69791.1 DNA-binding anti-repressor SinI [Halobacillus litoralis]
METLPRERKLDEEWVFLLKEAKAMGLSKDEVKNFLKQQSKSAKTV